jgi:hypothetical protein
MRISTAIAHLLAFSTTGKTMIAVRFNLCRAHIFRRTAKRSFAVRIFHGAR